MPTATFPEIITGFVPIDPMNLRKNLIIGGTQEHLGSPSIAHAEARSLFPKFLTGFCSGGLCEYTGQI